VYYTGTEAELPSSLAFRPRSKYTFRRVFLSFTKVYWFALVTSLNDDAKKQLRQRLNMTPLSMGAAAPDGAKCVDQVDAIGAKDMEGLMRSGIFVTMGLVPNEAIRSGRELAEAGVALWEERV